MGNGSSNWLDIAMSGKGASTTGKNLDLFKKEVEDRLEHKLTEIELKGAAFREQAEYSKPINTIIRNSNLSDDPLVANIQSYSQWLKANPSTIKLNEHNAEELEQKRQEEAKKLSDWAGKNWVTGTVGSLGSVGTSLMSGGDYIAKAVEQATIGKTLVRPGITATEATQAIRGGVSEDMSDTGKFLYNTAMSGIDSFVASFGGSGGAVLLGLGAASNAYDDIKARGGSEKQALVGGAVSGIFESLFEKVSIGNLNALKEMPVSSVKTIFQNLAKSSLTNFSEEAATEIANIAYDYLVMGDLSNYAYIARHYEAQYLAQGMSAEEAKAKAEETAKSDLLNQVLEAGASGALMGVGFTGAGTAMSEYSSYKAGEDIKSRSQQYDLVQLALQGDKNSQSRKMAENIAAKLDASKDATVGSREIGRLSNMMAYEAEQAAEKEAKKNKTSILDVFKPAKSKADTSAQTTEIVAPENTAPATEVEQVAAVQEANPDTHVVPTSVNLFMEAGDDSATAARKSEILARVTSGDTTLSNSQLRKLDLNSAATRAVLQSVTGQAVPQTNDTKTLLNYGRALVEQYAQANAEQDAIQSQIEAMAAEAAEQAEMVSATDAEQQIRQLEAEATAMAQQSETQATTEAPTNVEAAQPAQTDDSPVQLTDGRSVTKAEFVAQYKAANPGKSDAVAQRMYADAVLQNKLGSQYPAAVLQNVDSAAQRSAGSQKRSSVDTAKAESTNRTESPVEASEGKSTKAQEWTVKNMNHVLSKRKGAPKIVLGYDLADNENGSFDAETGTITLNAKKLTSQQALTYTLGHELVHSVPDAAQREALVDDILSMYAKVNSAEALEAELQSVRETYIRHAMRKSGLSRTEAEAKVDINYTKEEVASDFMRELFTSTGGITRLAKENRTLLEKARDWLENAKRTLLGESKNSAEARALYNEAEALVDRMDRALKNVKPSDTMGTENTEQGGRSSVDREAVDGKTRAVQEGTDGQWLAGRRSGVYGSGDASGRQDTQRRRVERKQRASGKQLQPNAVTPTPGSGAEKSVRVADAYGVKAFAIPGNIIRDAGYTLGFADDGDVYFADDVAVESAENVGIHEVTHTMLQNDFYPYREFLFTVENRLISSDGTSKVLGILAQHCGFDAEYDSLTYDQKLDVLSELSCWLIGTHAQYGSVERLDNTLLKDGRAYIEDLQSVLDQYKANNTETRFSAEAEEGVSSMPETDITESVDGDTTVATSPTGEPVAMTQSNGSARFSLDTYEADGRDYLASWLDKKVKSGDVTRAEADDIVKQMDGYYDLCKTFEDKYAPFGAWSKAKVVRDAKGNPAFSVIKANGDYAMNLDFSLVCKKRRTLDAVFGEMIQRGLMDDLLLEEEDIATINDIIRENGFETACALCFVDSKRYRQGKVADAFVTQYNDMVNLLIPDGSDIKADHFDFVGTGLYSGNATALHTVPTNELNTDALKKVMSENGKQTVPHKIAKHLLNNPSDRKLLTRGEFMNTDGFEAVKVKNPAVMKLYNSSKGSGGPKAAFSDVQYLGDILKKNTFTADKAYKVGGVRIQSFSDYVPRLVFDYIQMMADLAAKKLPAHAYTKEAAFAKQFGMTGVKINLSLVPAVVEGGVAPGLDANGDYVWFDGQSFGSDVNVKGSGKTGFDLAVEIQNAEGYSKNCGTIAVGISNEQIDKMLDDPDIRMIIPYHKSSLNHIVAVMNNIDQYKDYTGVQNTRYKSSGSKIDGKDFNFNEALLRTGDAKVAANEYLKWCKANGYIPKFDDFAGHENYYKLLEDFSTYDNGKAAPQGAVTMTFPKVGDAFGSMAQLIEEGLEEDAKLEGRREQDVPGIVDQIEKALKAGKDIRYSVDSDGRELSAGQQEFFKDSVVRDENGNLMVMYHGTANSGEFTIFDGNKLSNSHRLSQIGQGFYFTNVREAAEDYMQNSDLATGKLSPGKKPFLHKVYLDVKNPFNVDTDTLDLDAAKAVFMDGDYDYFFENWIPFYLNNKSVGNVTYTKAEVQSMSKAEKVSVYVDYLSQFGVKEVLSNMVRAFRDGEQSRLLDSMSNRLGYDGIVEEFKPGNFQYAVFDSAQIKRVTNINPTSDKDIRYSVDRDIEIGAEEVYTDSNKYEEENQYGQAGSGELPNHRGESSNAAETTSGETRMGSQADGGREAGDHSQSESSDSRALWDLIMSVPELAKKAGVVVNRPRITRKEAQLALAGLPAENAAIAKEAGNRALYSRNLATMTSGRLDKVYAEYSYPYNPRSTKAYLTYIDPYDFLALTTRSVEDFLDENPERLNEGENRQWGGQNEIIDSGLMYLRIDEDGNVIGHEGRHRMAALYREGVERVAVALATDRVDDAEPISIRKLFGQKTSGVNSYSSVYVHNMIPVSKEYETINRYAFGDVSEDNHFAKPNIRFSVDRDSTPENINPDTGYERGSVADSFMRIWNTGDREAALNVLEKTVERLNEMQAEQAEKRKAETTANTFRPAGRLTEDTIARNKRVIEELIAKYGKMDQTSAAQQEVRLPKQRDDKTKVRGFMQTAAAAEVTSEAVLNEFERAIVEGDAGATYVPIGDQGTLRRATEALEKEGFDSLLRQWEGKFEAGESMGKDDIAKAEQLYVEACNNRDTVTAMKLAAQIAVAGTQAGQTVQAMTLLKKMTPSGNLYYIQKAVDRLNKDQKGKHKDIVINEQLAKQLLEAETQEEIQNALDAICQDLANQMPVTLMDKWNTWRYLAMLGNPRTHIRNLLGNAVFTPARLMKDMLGATVEKALPVEQRTKAYTVSADLRDFAKQDAETMKDTLRGGGKYNPADMIRDKRRIFRSNALNAAEQFNSALLESEDWLFLKSAYSHALGSFLSARGADVSKISGTNSTREGRALLEEARAYAVKEAQKATYRDMSKVAGTINHLKRNTGLVGEVFLEGLVPFTKTPINIVKRGIEYSPAGLVKGVVGIAAKPVYNKTSTNWDTDFASRMENFAHNTAELLGGHKTASELIDELCAGLTGTAIVGIGVLLTKLGLLVAGHSDDDEDNFEELQGIQEYSLKIGDSTFTVDWTAPVALPLFVGSEIYSVFTADADEDVDALDAIMDGLTTMFEPMLSLSMLDGLNQTLSANKYGEEDDALYNIMATVISSYASQGVPTLFGQIARTVDDSRRTSFTPKGAGKVESWLSRAFQTSVQGKIPVAAEGRMLYIDNWGRADTESNVWMRALENFVSPGYINEIKTSPVDDELKRLAEAVNDTSVFPDRAKKYFSVDKEDYAMTQEEYQAHLIERGQHSYQLVSDITNDRLYAGLDDKTRAQAVTMAYDYASSIAKLHTNAEYEPDKWMLKLYELEQAGGDVAEYLLLRAESKISGNSLTEAALGNSSLTDKDVVNITVMETTMPESFTDPYTKGYEYIMSGDQMKQYESFYRDFLAEEYSYLIEDSEYQEASVSERYEMLKDIKEEVGKLTRKAMSDWLWEQGIEPTPKN